MHGVDMCVCVCVCVCVCLWMVCVVCIGVYVYVCVYRCMGCGTGLADPATTGPIFAVWCRGPKFTNFLHFVRIIDCSAGVCQLDNGMDNGFFCI